MPLRCAKCATLSPGILFNSLQTSYIPYTSTRYFALTGIGGNKSISCIFGNNIANARSIQNTAPEAPTMGTSLLNANNFAAVSLLSII